MDGMRIMCSPYTLKGKHVRHGALLRVQYPDGKTGYADLHPWPELGDEPLQEQYQKLTQGLLTNVTRRSLYFAKLDAQARAEGKLLLEGKSIPDSHYLAEIGEEVPPGWHTIKVKVTPDRFTDLVAYLPAVSQKVRIDCGGKGDLSWLIRLKPFADRIEFIEDPAPYNTGTWSQAIERYAIPFGIDRLHKEILEELPQCINIYKPAVEAYIPHDKTVVTSYLGHPLGQVCAAYEASMIPNPLIAGLNSHLVYESNSFSEQLSQGSPAFTVPQGAGFGFDDELEALKWQA